MMFRALLRARLQAFLAAYSGKAQSTGKKKPSTGKAIGMALLFAYCGIVFLGLFFGLFSILAQAFAGTDLAWVYFALYAILAFALMFIGSVFTTKAQLYEATDNELLLSMPIPPLYILASRVVILLVFNAVFHLVVALPALAAWLLNAPADLWQLLSFVVLSLALNLFTMGVTALVAWVISLITSRMRRKNLLSMVLFAVFFIAYMVVVMRANEYITRLAAMGQEVAAALGGIAPLYWLGSALAGESALYFALCLVILLAVFALAGWLLARSFITIATTQRGAPKARYKEQTLKVSKPTAALLRMEAKRLTGSAGYMMNAGLSAVFCLIGAIAIPFVKDDLLAPLTLLGLGSPELTAIAALAICGICSLFTFTASAVSLEGKNLWIVRTLPVSTAQILMAKCALHRKIAIVSALLPALSACIFLGADVLPLILVTAAYASLTASVGLAENLRHPKLDWINEMQPVKQGLAVIFTMLLLWAALLVPTGLYFALQKLVPPATYLCLAAAFFLLLDQLLLHWIRTGGAKRFEAL